MCNNDNFDAEWASTAEYARLYRSIGLQVLPSCLPSNTYEWKRPIVPWKQHSKTLISDDHFEKMYGPKGAYNTHRNMCAITGINQLFVIDIDVYKGPEAQLFLDQLKDLQETAGDFETPTQRTGGGGLQIFFKASDGWSPPTFSSPVFNVDVRGEGGLVIIPPSLHTSGKNYEWVEGLEPWNIPIATCPRYICEAIDDLAKRTPEASYRPQLKIKTNASEYTMDAFGNIVDGREKKMTTIIWRDLVELYRQSPIMQEGKLLDEFMMQSFDHYCMQVKSRIPEPGTHQSILLEREGRGITLFKKKWAAAYGKWHTEIKEAAISPPQFGYGNDTSVNATNKSEKTPNFSSSIIKGKGSKDHLFIARKAQEDVGIKNIFNTESGVYHWHSEGVWRKEPDTAIKQIIQKTIERLEETVTSSLVNSVIDVFKTEIFRSRHLFNIGNPETVNCQNGEVELQGGVWQLVNHRQELYRTTQLPVFYDPEATTSKFNKFLDEIFQGDDDADEKKRALLELIGYTLMSHARHEKFIILVGAGANGKSVLLTILQALCGIENVAAVQPSNFDRAFQRAHLDQKLANIITEIAQGEVIADAELKGITSGEPSTVEHKYGQPFVMYPYATCWFGTNHMPRTKDFSDALFRRAVIFSFNRIFNKSEQNPNLKEELKGELSGILTAALNAYAKALLNGFTEPPSSIAAKQEWRLEVDQVAQYVSEKCLHDPKEETLFKDLFKSYTNWAVEEGVRLHMSQKGFSSRLGRLGFGKRHTATSRYITGIKLIDDYG